VNLILLLRLRLISLSRVINVLIKYMRVLLKLNRALGPNRFKLAYLPGILLIATSGLLF
jgi:hypothetical protein